MSTSYQAYRMSPSLPHVQPSLTYVHQADRMSTKLTEWTPSSVYLPRLLNVYQAYRMSAKLTECQPAYRMSTKITACLPSLPNAQQAYWMSTKLTECLPSLPNDVLDGRLLWDVECLVLGLLHQNAVVDPVEPGQGFHHGGQIYPWMNGREQEEGHQKVREKKTEINARKLKMCKSRAKHGILCTRKEEEKILNHTSGRRKLGVVEK